MTDVILHIYDVTNTGSDKTNSTIVQINKIFKDGIGLDGIFHSAIQEKCSEDFDLLGLCCHIDKVHHLEAGYGDGSVSYCEKSWDSSHEEEVSPQGNLIGPGVVEFCDGGPQVKNFISFAGPHAGIASVPLCGAHLAPSGYLKLPNVSTE